MATTGDNLRGWWTRMARKAEDAAADLILDGFRDQLAQVRTLLAAGDATSAIELLDAVLRERPDHVGALALLGAAEAALGRDDRAADAFGRAVAARPGDPHALIGLGTAEVALGQHESALEHLGRGVDAAGGDRSLLASAYLARGRAWRGLGDLDKAIRELRKSVAEASEDPEPRAALGEALLANPRGSNDEARRHLERAVESERPPVAALLCLADLELFERRFHAAADLYEKAREHAAQGRGPASRAQLADALIGLGNIAAAGGDPTAAHQRYLEALDAAPRRAAIHALLADLHRGHRDFHAALAAYDRALAIMPTAALLSDAIATANRVGDRERAVRWANDLLAIDTSSPIALAARAADLIDRGQLDAATGLLESTAPTVEISIELARLEQAREPGPSAAARAARLIHRALEARPDDERARAALADARAQQFAVPTGGDITQLAAVLGGMLATRADLAGRVGDVSRATAELDQPLMVTVMGEFSSGKSSFVNAFIGAEVAATGIAPTTATINVVKYGHERGGCIWFRDGASQRVAWEQLQPRLQALTPEDARAIDRVEIFLPLEHLAKVHIVDTPGLNSIRAEHEETARRFITTADAVVWVFTAGQGGKASERKALDAIRAQGKRVLGVLNKRDQLTNPEIAEVVAHVTDQLGDRVEVVVPFSARQALAWRAGTSANDGNWSVLLLSLETRFFAQARSIKRAACARRLAEVIASARGDLESEVRELEQRRAQLEQRRDQLAAAAANFADEVVAPVRRHLAARVAELYQRAAAEVISLVRPRQLPFGNLSAAPADRDYLIALLDDGYDGLLRAAAAEVAAAIAPLWAANDIPTGTLHDICAPLVRAQSYVAGYLAGGAIDSFFRHDLPKLSLEPEAVHHALFRAAPDLELLVAQPLCHAGETALTSAADRLARDAEHVAVTIFDLEVGLLRALDGLSQGIDAS